MRGHDHFVIGAGHLSLFSDCHGVQTHSGPGVLCQMRVPSLPALIRAGHISEEKRESTVWPLVTFWMALRLDDD